MKTKKAFLLAMLALCALHLGISRSQAQGTAFTYQGRLNSGGSPANGNYDFTFALYNSSSTNTGQVGGTLTNLDVGVTNGLFIVTLDFGENFPGANRWLSIGVRTNGGASFTALNPLQELTPTPYAIYSPNAGSAATATSATTAGTASSVAAANITGVVSLAQLPGTVVTNTETGVTLGGTFSGTGTGLAGLNASQLSSGVVPVNVLPGFQATSNYSTVGGGQGNAISGQWATIGGGNNNTNAVIPSSGTAATIGGGQQNLITNGFQPTIGGGFGNIANGNYATVPGGIGNLAAGTAATASGFENKATNAGAVVSGGGNNIAGGLNSSVGGGSANQASQTGSVVGGGYNNTNTGTNATIGGGSLNLVTNAYATVPGGLSNIAGGLYSFAAGQQAQATNTGSFVWADSQSAVFASTNTNQFSVRANGGVVFATSGAGVQVDGIPVLTAAPGLIQGYEINDGGSSAYQTFQQAVQAIGGDTTLTFSNLFQVTATNGGTPAFSLTINGSAFGSVVGFSGCEGISQPYAYVVEVSNSSGSVNPDSEVGLTGSLSFSRNGRTTTFGGIVTACALASGAGTNFLYTVQIESPLAYLALTTDYKMYQTKTAPAVASTVYEADSSSAAMTQNLVSSYSTHNSLTQFGETDLNFFSRLLENEGVFYFFNQSSSPPSLILGDSTAAYLSSPNSPFSYYGNTATNMPAGAEYIRTFQKASHQSTLTSTVNASAFLTPTASLIESNSGTEGTGQYYEFGNSVATTTYDTQLAGVREGVQTENRAMISGTATAPDLRAGYTFALTDQSGAGLGNTYLVASIHHAGFVRVTNGVSTYFYGNEFEVVPASLSYRPALKTPKPVAQPCTATVTGASGDEIDVDSHARVKVLFHWDRYDADNDTSSAFIPITSPWAGNGRGMIFLPRVGDEVLVSFILGDPDQPIITGSLYNDTDTPPFLLPDNKTESGIVTLSSVGGGGFNELMFDDLKGSEQVYLHAQRDLNMTVLNNFTQIVDGSMTANVSDDLSLTAGTQISLNGTVAVTGSMSLNGQSVLAGNNGGSLTNLNAAKLTGGPVPASVLPSNLALLNGTQTFVGANTFNNSLVVNTGAGTLTIDNDLGVVPGITAAGGLASGHMRMRNGVEVWPDPALANSGYLDVRNTNANPTITLTGASGAIVCSNVIANGVLLTSDRNAKQNFTPLDPETALKKVAAIPVTEWNYKSDPAGTKHIGPMAQDFHAAFGLNGGDDTHISVVDEGGVALAAIQALNQKLGEKDAEIQELRKSLAELKNMVRALAEKK